VRRLEAIRRSVGGVERAEDGTWSIPGDYREIAARHETRLARTNPVELEMLSSVPLEGQAETDGATWLDRQLLSEKAVPLRDAGFGREVKSALAARRMWLTDHELASDASGSFQMRPEALALLQRRELLRVAGGLSRETGLSFSEVGDASRIAGVVRRRLDLASGRFAMVENGRDFSLVPWRPVLERALGKEVSGIMRGGSISWTIGRDRGPSL
jgi:hypothetical protein